MESKHTRVMMYVCASLLSAFLVSRGVVVVLKVETHTAGKVVGVVSRSLKSRGLLGFGAYTHEEEAFCVHVV